MERKRYLFMFACFETGTQKKDYHVGQKNLTDEVSIILCTCTLVCVNIYMWLYRFSIIHKRLTTVHLFANGAFFIFIQRTVASAGGLYSIYVSQTVH